MPRRPPLALSDVTLLRLLALVAVPASFVWDAVANMSGAPMCPSHRLLGWMCPACGLSRSFVAIGNGMPALATQHNLAGPLLWGGLVLALVHWGAELAGGPWRPAWLRTVTRSWIVAVIVLMVLGWALHLLGGPVEA